MDCAVHMGVMYSPLRVSPSTRSTGVSASAVAESVKQRLWPLWPHRRFGGGGWAEMVLGKLAHIPVLTHILCACVLPCHPCLHTRFSWGCCNTAWPLPFWAGVLAYHLCLFFCLCNIAGQLGRKPGDSSCPLEPCPSLYCPTPMGSPVEAALYLFPHPSFLLFPSCQKNLFPLFFTTSSFSEPSLLPAFPTEVFTHKFLWWLQFLLLFLKRFPPWSPVT